MLWSLTNDLVTYDGWLYVSPASPLLQKIMATIHEDGHEGVQRTLHCLCQDFHFPDMRRLIQDFVCACTTSQQYKLEHLLHASLLLSLPVSTMVWAGSSGAQDRTCRAHLTSPRGPSSAHLVERRTCCFGYMGRVGLLPQQVSTLQARGRAARRGGGRCHAPILGKDVLETFVVPSNALLRPCFHPLGMQGRLNRLVARLKGIKSHP